MATINKRGPSYYLTWSEGGAQYRRSIGKIDRRAAEAVRAEKEAELAGLIPARRQGHTVRMVLQDYLDWSQQARPDSYKGTKYALLPIMAALGDHQASTMDPAHVDRWAALETRAPATVAKSIKMARAAYRRAMKLRQVQDSPFDRASLPRVVTSRAPPWYTKAELDALYAAPHGHLWRFMANTGVRRGELVKAVRGDVRNDILQIESSPTGRTKSGKWRWVTLNRSARDALSAMGPDRLVACHADTLGDWFAQDLKVVNEQRAEAGLPPIKGTAHWLRHSFCTHLAQADVSLHDIQQLAGHSSIAMTEKYSHHKPGAGRAAVEKLDD